MSTTSPNALAHALRGFFAEHLPGVRGLSPNTTLSYRDAIALLLRFFATRCKRHVDRIDLDDLDPEGVIAFLDHLEKTRNNCAATRNARLAAIHAFARYIAARSPEHMERCQRLLAVPFKRAGVRAVDYLEGEEFRAMLEAANRHTRDGRRDYTLLLTLFNTGARVQELLDLRPVDLQLVRPFQLRLCGKGRRERFCPIWPKTAVALRELVADDLAEDCCGTAGTCGRSRAPHPPVTG